MNSSKQLNLVLQIRNQAFKTRFQTITARNIIPRSAFARTMSTNTTQLKVEDPEVKATNNTGTQPSEQEQEQNTSQSGPLPLPEPTSDTTQLNVNGEGVKLDHLGPLVVNKDGTLSRIANWDKMAEIEKQNTLRILGKRNQLRLGNLKSKGEEGESQ